VSSGGTEDRVAIAARQDVNRRSHRPGRAQSTLPPQLVSGIGGFSMIVWWDAASRVMGGRVHGASGFLLTEIGSALYVVAPVPWAPFASKSVSGGSGLRRLGR
jgi:hypothetical protein